ncbi:Uncharacterised protein r2_g683 [Pycnogonum litorale]
MTDGKVKEALRLLGTTNGRKGIMDLEEKIQSKTVREILRNKHPQAKPAEPSALISDVDKSSSFHPIIFDDLDGRLIQKTAMRMHGSGGLSCVDAINWRRFCMCFGKDSQDLCCAIAAVGRRLATVHVDPAGLSALISCRLIPLDKNPGVRPIGICEISKRIITKAILQVSKGEILSATGTKQLCTGFDSGCEAAVYAMESMLKDLATEGILLVDATNAFNSLNRHVALHNIQTLCPALSTIV